MDLLVKHGGASPPLLPYREPARVRRMEVLLHDRLAQPVLLSELAEACGLSRSYLIQNFREATGGTPVRYLTRLRMESARRLLETTSLPVVNVGPNMVLAHFLWSGPACRA